MSIRESALERKMMRWAIDRGAIVVKVQGTRGWPDRAVVLPNGRTLFVEFKRPGQKPDPLQEHILKQLRMRGCPATWADSEESFKLAFERAL